MLVQPLPSHLGQAHAAIVGTIQAHQHHDKQQHDSCCNGRPKELHVAAQEYRTAADSTAGQMSGTAAVQVLLLLC